MKCLKVCPVFHSQQLSDISAYCKAWSSHGRFHWPLLILCCSPEPDEAVSSSSWFSLHFGLHLPFGFSCCHCFHSSRCPLTSPFLQKPSQLWPNYELSLGRWSCCHDIRFYGGIEQSSARWWCACASHINGCISCTGSSEVARRSAYINAMTRQIDKINVLRLIALGSITLHYLSCYSIQTICVLSDITALKFLYSL